MSNTCFEGSGSCINLSLPTFIINANFQMDLESKYENFGKTFENALNANAPKKTKFLHGNQKSHVDKSLRKAITKHSQLKNKENRTKQLQDITKYKKYQNLVVKLGREIKTQYYDNIQTSKYSKPFWDKCQPCFSNKHAHGDSEVILVEKENIITHKNEAVQKEPLLVNNNEIAKTPQ